MAHRRQRRQGLRRGEPAGIRGRARARDMLGERDVHGAHDRHERLRRGLRDEPARRIDRRHRARAGHDRALVPRLVLLAAPAVRSAVARELGRDIEYHASLGSTQTRARTIAEDAAARGIVVADEQSAGQGTHGRSWHAAKGTSLLASWIVRPAPLAPALYAALAGVGIARALDRLGVGSSTLKWPNDVELDGRKVAGALANATSDGRGGVLVLGSGISVHQRA